MKGIEIIKDITFNENTMYQLSYRAGRIIDPDYSYTGFNEDGTFTVCFGMGL